MRHPNPRRQIILGALLIGGLGIGLAPRAEATQKWLAQDPPAAPLVAPAPQIARPGGWKDCSYNDVVIGCISQQLPRGLRIDWKDGLHMVYLETAAPRPEDPPLLRDSLGGLWRRERLIQGNILMVNLRTGNRILIPLRHPCQAPLKGEVGYCRY